MSAHVPDPTRAVIEDALVAVGVFAEALGVEVSPLLHRWTVVDDTIARFTVPTLGPAGPFVGVLFGRFSALGWTCLAHWIEHGGHPIERISRLGGASAVGWRVTLAGRLWSRSVATTQEHARVALLAEALLVLRRWSCPVKPWGLKDLRADALDRIQREASVRALGPIKAVVITSPIPNDYLAAHGTAAE